MICQTLLNTVCLGTARLTRNLICGGLWTRSVVRVANVFEVLAMARRGPGKPAGSLAFCGRIRCSNIPNSVGSHSLGTRNTVSMRKGDKGRTIFPWHPHLSASTHRTGDEIVSEVQCKSEGSGLALSMCMDTSWVQSSRCGRHKEDILCYKLRRRLSISPTLRPCCVPCPARNVAIYWTRG